MPFKSLEKTFNEASALVRLIDGFTGRAVALPVKVRVRLAGSNPATRGDVDFVAKRPGEYGFARLSSGDYELAAESPFFFAAALPFSYDAAKGYDGPTVAVLEPAPAYPFPPGTTLLRGVVVDATEEPAKGASVSVVERPEFNSETDDTGEFVLFFKDLKYKEGNDSDFHKTFEDEKWVYYVVPKGGSESDVELTARAEFGAAAGEVKVRVAAEKANTLGPDEEGKPKRIILT
jgi:hypothetical protein